MDNQDVSNDDDLSYNSSSCSLSQESESESDTNEKDANVETKYPPIHLNHTTSSELSFNLEKPPTYTEIIKDEDIGLNEEELKSLARSLAPRVTSLLDTNEKVLETLISQGMSWSEDDRHYNHVQKCKEAAGDGGDVLAMMDYNVDDDEPLDGNGKYLHKYIQEYRLKEEDGMEDEWNRLSNSEQLLREELGMLSLGFNFIANENDDSPLSKDMSYEEMNEGDGDNIQDEEGLETKDYNDIVDILRTNSKNLLDEVEQDEKTSTELQQSHNIAHKELPKSPLPSSPTRQAYTLYDHAKNLDLQFAHSDLGYPTCPLLTIKDAEALLDVPSFRHEMLNMEKNGENIELGGSGHSELSREEDDLQRATSTRFKDNKSREEAIREILQCTREYVKPMNRASLSRIYEGLVDQQSKSMKNKIKQPQKKKQQQHGIDIIDDGELKDGGASISSDVDSQFRNELLPVRTVAIQIRPDVLCGAVMDAIHTAIHSLRGEITKRQGNHLRGLVPGCWVPASSYVDFRPNEGENSNAFVQLLTSPVMSPIHGVMNGMCLLPPFVVDAQLCTKKKSRDGDRICLFRFFRIHENQVIDGAIICPPSPPHASTDSFHADLIPDLKECNNNLREAAALFQRMSIVATTGGNIAFNVGDDESDSSPERDNSSKSQSLVKKVLTSPLKLFSPSKDTKEQSTPQRKVKKSLTVKFQSRNNNVIQGEKAAQRFASKKLMNSFLPTPSVADENEGSNVEPIPSLSSEDWPFVQSSWRYITLCLNELDNRDLNYSSLVSCPFGAFPALPTLDVQLCSQIKALCKDVMISSLLKGAQELEEFAREAEYSCAKLIQLLQPTFLSYNLEPPPQPEPISLSSYPLDFIPPEVSCPPWGQRVVEALNVIAAQSPSSDSCFLNDVELNATANINGLSGVSQRLTLSDEYNESISEFQKARQASSKVLEAFMKQEDEELSARLGRKNLQVMDRLAKMQAHKRNLIITIRDSYGINLPATKNANRFHAHAQQRFKGSTDEGANCDDTNFFPASDQVPLITCRSLSGKVPATCFVTCHQILLVTHPILGEAQTFIYKLLDISVQVNAQTSKSILNPIPATVSVYSKVDGAEIFSFRPLMGAHPFKDFVDIIIDVASESEDTLEFSSRGGLLHMFDEKAAVERAALGTNDMRVA